MVEMFDPRIDKPGLITGTIEFILGVLFFPLIFYSITSFLKNSVFGRLFCDHFGIKNHGVFDIGNKITSSTFAFLACLTGLTVSNQCRSHGDALNDRYYILDNYLIFGFSYFFYDVVSMYMVYSTEKKEEVTVSVGQVVKFFLAKPLILLHHILVPLVGFPLLMHYRGGTGDCLLGASFLIEASTPFVSLRVILVHLHMKESRAYVANGLMMLFSFFLCRVMLFPYLYCWYSTVVGMSLVATLASIPAWVHLAVIGLWSPQLIWFHRMLKGSIKLIRESKKRNEKPSLPETEVSHEKINEITENKEDRKDKENEDETVGEAREPVPDSKVEQMISDKKDD